MSERCRTSRDYLHAMSRRALNVKTVVVTLAFVVAGCSTDDSDDAGGAPQADPNAAFWSTCPETPVYDRSLESVTELGLDSPAAAVHAVAPDETRIGQVTTDAAATSAEVEVRLGDETGVFYVSKRPSGWLVKGGKGCASWPAGAAVIGPRPDCETEAYCGEVFVTE